MNKLHLWFRKKLWHFAGNQFRVKESPGKFTLAFDNDYLECRLLTGSEDEAAILLYSYSPISSLISAKIFDKKTQSFDNHTSLPVSLVENTGIEIEVFKYGFHFQEKGLASYLLKSFFWYYLSSKFKIYKYRIIKVLTKLTTKRPNYLKIRISILKLTMTARFNGGHGKNNDFTYSDIMRHLFGKHWIHIRDLKLNTSNVRFVLNSLADEGLFNYVQNTDTYSVSLSCLPYLEEHYRNEERHSDSTTLTRTAVVLTVFIGWKSFIELLAFLKCALSIGVPISECSIYWPQLLF
tara:strand:- start:3020 stop:3898 length:879 start_codon:yes stop_codon:yes gene_type:complete